MKYMLLFLLVCLAPLTGEPVAEVEALYRDGQTFITWKESGNADYRVYRHTAPISSANLSKAEMIAEIPQGSAVWQEMFEKNGQKLLSSKKRGDCPWIIPRLVIEPVGEDNQVPMVPEGTGLLVWTVSEEKRTSWYAVTAVSSGKEDRKISAAGCVGPIAEEKAPIGAVRYYIQAKPSNSHGVRRARDQIKKLEQEGKEVPAGLRNKADAKEYYDWYIMYMPYHEWNTEYIGYAFAFHLTRGAFENYAKSKKVPTAHLDGIGTMNVFSAGYANYGTGDFSKNALPTWYFGYGSQVTNRASGRKVKQEIRNYIQYRIMQSVLFARRLYKIDTPQFHLNGNSMGASGVIGLAMAYPDFITSIWANQGMTDYTDTRGTGNRSKTMLWESSTWGNIGSPDMANSVKLIPHGDSRLDWVLKHDGMAAHDFRKAANFLAVNVDKSFPLLIIGHTHGDGSIPAKNQGYPFEEYIRNSRHTFAYALKDGGHGWGSAYSGSRMGPHVFWNQSRPGFSGCPAVELWRYNKKLKNATGYACHVGWGAPGLKMKGKERLPVDTDDEWRMPLIYQARPDQEKPYFCDITPRNLQNLKPAAGDRFTFRILDLDGDQLRKIADFSRYVNGENVQPVYKPEGSIKADKHGLVLIPAVPIDREGCLVEVRRQ